MRPIGAGTPAEWDSASLSADQGWLFQLDEAARADLLAAVKRAYDPARTLFSYSREEFDLGRAEAPIRAAVRETFDGRGISLLRGMPRDELSEQEFEFLTWGIGLHLGVARPQSKASQYISQVRNIGTDYRSPTGRGYSSNAELDFHTDGADLIVLTCYNQARAGGMSMCSSSLTAHNILLREAPALLELLYGAFNYSRQAEQAPGEAPHFTCPIYGVAEDRLFGRWVRNRVEQAQKLPDVPQLNARQREALDLLDAVVRRPALMYPFFLQPGDMQLLHNHTSLHSRTEFEDHDEPEKRRLLYRLWLAPPNSRRLPPGWVEPYKSCEPGAVRGGIRGQDWNAEKQGYERRQAAALGMTWAV